MEKKTLVTHITKQPIKNSSLVSFTSPFTTKNPSHPYHKPIYKKTLALSLSLSFSPPQTLATNEKI
jgi:hypothetical protein